MHPLERGLLRRWIPACVAGELLGLGAAGAIGYGMYSAWGDPRGPIHKALFVLVMTLAGALEGTITGSLQAWVLRRRYPQLSLRRYATFTASVAALGWLVGMLPSTFIPDGAPDQPMAEPPVALVLLFAALFGVLAGALFGAAQAVALRAHAAHVWRWIVANAIAWGLALPWTYAAPALMPSPIDPVLASIAFAAGGAIAGLVLATVTGVSLAWLPPRAPWRRRPWSASSRPCPRRLL